jgi:signal transduction histidine kinase
MRPAYGRQDPYAPARLSHPALAACLAATLVAGPWPDLAPATLLWRVPVALTALVLAWRGTLRRSQVGWASALVLAAVALDALAPAAITPTHAAAAMARQVSEIGHALAGEAQRGELKTLLVGGGGEAQPEELFTHAEKVRSATSRFLDTLILADDRGAPVAWSKAARRVPVGLRLLGERTVAVEAAVDGVWLWWREPVYEGGRPVGALVAGSGVAEAGARRTLGVWAGRAARLRLTAGEGTLVPLPAAVGRLGVEVVRARPEPWSAPGGAAVVFVLLVLATARGWWRLPAGLAVAAGALAAGWLPPQWWLVVGLALLAWAARWVGRVRWGRWAAVPAVGLLAWVQVGILAELGVVVPAQRALAPSLLVVGAAMAWTALLVRLPSPRRLPPAAVVGGSWVVLGVGALRADPLLLAVGVAAVAAFGLAHRHLAAAAAAVLLLAGADSGQRRLLVGTTESVLARRESADRPARTLLMALPEGATGELVRLPPPEQVVVLGRLAQWLQFERTLPGAALVLTSPDGERQGSWGAVPFQDLLPPQVLASRALADGWRIAVLAPPYPEDVLAALDEGGVGVPVAAFDRGGAPVARGGIFRPLSPTHVGRAMAAERSWGRVQVGERRFIAYLRAHGQVVLAVPWVRRPAPEWLLLAASLALWGLAPVALWEKRQRFAAWWQQRRTFVGRLRFLLAGVTALPVLLLAQALPQQWVRQRELMRLELGRAVSRPLASMGWEQEMAWLVRDLNGVVAVYRGGEIVFCSRPDLLARGLVPSLPSAEAYTRAVRGWREPVVLGGNQTSVFAPLRVGEEPLVVGVLGMQVSASGVGPAPSEWFAVLGVWGVVLALVIGEGLGRRLADPLQRLVEAARALAEGRVVREFPVARDEDLGALSRGFATMAEQVQRREEDVRRERDLLESVLGALSAAVIVVGERGDVQLANPAARRLLGEGEDLSQLEERFAVPLQARARRALDGEASSEVLRPPGGADQAWRLHAVPLSSPLQRRVVLVMEDLSDVARAERLASLAELARIAAHEVKNPLTPIRLWAEELQVALERGDGAVVEVARVAAGQILERVQHLTEVAQGFSNLVALEHWEPEEVDVPKLAAEVVGEYAQVLHQRGIEMEIVGSAAGTVFADRRWLARALRHLLDNSTRAMENVPGSIVVEVSCAAGQVVLAVRDSGGGVPEGHLGRLFEPHFSTQSQGSGLGLAVVQRVAQRAGGRAEAKNTGQGLEVTLVLPGAPAG